MNYAALSRILSNNSIDQSSCKQREVLGEKQCWDDDGVVVVSSLQSSSVGVYYYSQYNIMLEECSELHISCKSSLKLQTRSLSWVPSAATKCVLCVSVPIWDVGRNGDTTWHKAEYDVCCGAGNCSVVVVAVVLDHPCLWFMLHHPLTLSNQLVLAPPFPSNINPGWYRVNLDLIWIKEEGAATLLRLWGANPIFITAVRGLWWRYDPPLTHADHCEWALQ